MNAINWFDIPMTESGRAREFYSHVLGTELAVVSFGEQDMILLPYEQGKGVGGAITKDPNRQPSGQGTLVYFAAQNFPGGLDGCVSRVAAAGGAVVVPRTNIGEHGFIALVADSEGNTIGFHEE
ncbi:MAG: VOC family protein [Myxococcota bacterium]